MEQKGLVGPVAHVLQDGLDGGPVQLQHGEVHVRVAALAVAVDEAGQVDDGVGLVRGEPHAGHAGHVRVRRARVLALRPEVEDALHAQPTRQRLPALGREPVERARPEGEARPQRAGRPDVPRIERARHLHERRLRERRV